MFAAYRSNKSAADMDRKLFLAILKVHDIVVDTKAVANELSTEDQPCTAMAVQKRLQKIKTQIKNGGGEGYISSHPSPLRDLHLLIKLF